MVKVSIIIPVYNTEQYLNECLRSVINQTEHNLEIIVVDDGSTDHGMDIARDYEIKDSRFHTITHGCNKKLGAARNTGLQKATGDYIMFLDSDDRLPYNAVELLQRKAERESAQMVFGKMYGVTQDQQITHNKDKKPVLYINDKIDLYKQNQYDNLRNIDCRYWLIGSVCNRIYNRVFLMRNHILFTEGVYWEDVLFSIRTWYIADRIYAIQDNVYNRTYRTDPNNPSITQYYDKKKYEDRDILIKETYEFFKNQKKFDTIIANNMLRRIEATTKNMVVAADPTIKDEVNEWYELHKKVTNEYLNQLK